MSFKEDIFVVLIVGIWFDICDSIIGINILKVVDLFKKVVIVIIIEMSDFFYYRIRSKERWFVK